MSRTHGCGALHLLSPSPLCRTRQPIPNGLTPPQSAVTTERRVALCRSRRQVALKARPPPPRRPSRIPPRQVPPWEGLRCGRPQSAAIMGMRLPQRQSGHRWVVRARPPALGRPSQPQSARRSPSTAPRLLQSAPGQRMQLELAIAGRRNKCHPTDQVKATRPLHPRQPQQRWPLLHPPLQHPLWSPLQHQLQHQLQQQFQQ